MGIITTNKIKLLIVDDHEVVRLGLKGLFSNYSDFEVVGDAENGEKALKKIEILHPQVVLMDIRMPGMGGIEACRQITETVSGVRVIMLTAFMEPEELQASFAAGASGYVLKGTSSENLVRAIRAVSRGETYLDPESTDRVLKLIRGRGGEKLSGSKLSEREEEILALVARGNTNREIGKSLFLSENTVRNHVSRILDKLGFSNRSQAAAYMARRNLREHNNTDKPDE